MQHAMFLWVQTRNGAMWVHYGTGGLDYIKRHRGKLIQRRPDLEVMIVDLPNPYAPPVKVSDV